MANDLLVAKSYRQLLVFTSLLEPSDSTNCSVLKQPSELPTQHCPPRFPPALPHPSKASLVFSRGLLLVTPLFSLQRVTEQSHLLLWLQSPTSGLVKTLLLSSTICILDIPDTSNLALPNERHHLPPQSSIILRYHDSYFYWLDIWETLLTPPFSSSHLIHRQAYRLFFLSISLLWPAPALCLCPPHLDHSH